MWDKEKETTRQHRLWESEVHALQKFGVEKKKTCSTNFLNTTVIHQKFEKDYLFDMETYDFYDICKKNGIKKYSCIRFVTDYVLPLDTEESADQYFKHGYFELKKVQSQLSTMNGDLPNEMKGENKPNMESMKKFVRLKMRIPFDFIFALNLEECRSTEKMMEKLILINERSVEKYYLFFLENYRKKLQQVGGKRTTGNILQQNREKHQSYIQYRRRQKQKNQQERREESWRSQESPAGRRSFRMPGKSRNKRSYSPTRPSRSLKSRSSSRLLRRNESFRSASFNSSSSSILSMTENDKTDI